MAHWEAESNRTALVYIRLERSCGTLTWGKTSWSALKAGPASSSSAPDYNLGANPEDMVSRQNLQVHFLHILSYRYL